jgi:hypothetical protein
LGSFISYQENELFYHPWPLPQILDLAEKPTQVKDLSGAPL